MFGEQINKGILDKAVRIGKVIAVAIEIILLIWKLLIAIHVIHLRHYYYDPAANGSVNPILVVGILLIIFTSMHLVLIIVRLLLQQMGNHEKTIIIITQICLFIETALFLGIIIAGVYLLGKSNSRGVLQANTPQVHRFLSNLQTSSNTNLFGQTDCQLPKNANSCFTLVKTHFDTALFLCLAGFLFILCLSKVEFHLLILKPDRADLDDYDFVDEYELIKSFVVVNWTCFVVSSVMVGISIWMMRYQPYELLALDINSSRQRAPIWLSIAAIGAFVSLIGLFRNQLKYRLSFGHFFLFILSLIATIGAIIWFIDESSMVNASARRLVRFNQLYGQLDSFPGTEYTAAIDHVQRKYQCCGMVNGPNDYIFTELHKNSTSEIGLPVSCCPPRHEATCATIQLGELMTKKANVNLFTTPCLDRIPLIFEVYYAHIALIYALLFVVIIVAVFCYLSQAKLMNFGPIFSGIIGIVQISTSGVMLRELLVNTNELDYSLLGLNIGSLISGILMILLMIANIGAIFITSRRLLASTILSFLTHTINFFNAGILFGLLYVLIFQLLAQAKETVPEISINNDDQYKILLILTYSQAFTTMTYVCAARVSLAGVRMLLAQ
ncbi:cd9 antigen [Cichlidogyrus casuarinus]|uniref:Cd9 antigen n=1 Tax=Cichlidogyrus casuarinus TaxID=1844966 RepID=A0ABD2PSB1_9PLAT